MIDHKLHPPLTEREHQLPPLNPAAIDVVLSPDIHPQTLSPDKVNIRQANNQLRFAKLYVYAEHALGHLPARNGSIVDVDLTQPLAIQEDETGKRELLALIRGGTQTVDKPYGVVRITDSAGIQHLEMVDGTDVGSEAGQGSRFGRLPIDRHETTIGRNMKQLTRFHTRDESRLQATLVYDPSEPNRLLVADHSTNGTDVIAVSQALVYEEGQPEAIDRLRDQAFAKVIEATPLADQNNRGTYIHGYLRAMAMALLEKGSKEDIANVLEVIERNSYHEKEITPVFGRDLFDAEDQKKARFLEMYRHNPEVAKLLVREKISGFHGTGSGSLFGILHRGELLSARDARRSGQAIRDGERLVGDIDGTPYISFADWREPDSISRYANPDRKPKTLESLEAARLQMLHKFQEFKKLYGSEHPFTKNALLVADDIRQEQDFILANPDSLEAKLLMANFPVAFGLRADGFQIYDIHDEVPQGSHEQPVLVKRVSTGIAGEFVVTNGRVSLKSLPVIAVPNEHMTAVAELFSRYHKKAHIVDLASIVD